MLMFPALSLAIRCWLALIVPFPFYCFATLLFLMLRTIPKFWGRYLYPSKSGLAANHECPLWCFRSNFDFQHLKHFLILELCAKDLSIPVNSYKKNIIVSFFQFTFISWVVSVFWHLLFALDMPLNICKST